jgi:hypothetical protein
LNDNNNNNVASKIKSNTVMTTGTIISRRDALVSTVAAATAAGLSRNNISPANAADDDADQSNNNKIVPIGAKWKAVDGLNSVDKQFVSFDMNAYKAMKNDPTRTPFFKQAIERRLGSSPESSMTVIDLGTGPFALFAIMAAEAGAGKVYAIEADPDIAASARETVQKAGYDDIITILEGFSNQITLPGGLKADLCIAEIVGSVASEEGAYATIRDAHERLLKHPDDPSSWIPNRIQTYAAPASYTLHNLLGPPEFDWTKLGGEPVRFSCRDRGLELLADPVLVEDISFCDIIIRNRNKAATNNNSVVGTQNNIEVTFTVDAARMKENEGFLFDEFRRGKSSVADSERLAATTAHSLSGIGLWPRLYLSDSIVIDSRRYGDGAHQGSHWQTVLPIVSPRPVGGLKGGEKVKVAFDFNLPDDVTKPPSYSIQGTVQYS